MEGGNGGRGKGGHEGGRGTGGMAGGAMEYQMLTNSVTLLHFTHFGWFPQLLAIFGHFWYYVPKIAPFLASGWTIARSSASLLWAGMT